MKKRGRHGFSLAELMLAFVVLSVLSVVLIGVVPSTIIGLKGASQRANAALLAQTQFEELRRSGFGSIIASVEPYPTASLERTDYTYRIEVAEAQLSSGEMMSLDIAKLVHVVVDWQSQTGPQTYKASAVMFKRI
ncbi:MAG: prepilin-type N-terminal cleavage/methylation domain-containing protein [Vulcanimicrobiota bacterium]